MYIEILVLFSGQVFSTVVSALTCPALSCPALSCLGLRPTVPSHLLLERKTCIYVGGESETGFVLQSHWSETGQSSFDAPCFISA